MTGSKIGHMKKSGCKLRFGKSRLSKMPLYVRREDAVCDVLLGRPNFPADNQVFRSEAYRK
jgi:hypothetical protein